MKSPLTVSIVTACRNSERYVDKTLSSVLGQHYPNLQYVVVDGASTDATFEIVKQYRDEIAVAVSEPDAGQYHGIQKGLNFCEGEIMSYLNADDMYYPWTLSVVNDVFQKFPEVQWIVGQHGYMNADGQCIRISANAGPAYPREYIQNGWYRPPLAGYLQQESMFWRKSLWQKAGGLNLNYPYAADFELWCRFARHADLYAVAAPLALFRKHRSEQRSSVSRVQYKEEVDKICKELSPPSCLWRMLASRSRLWEYLFRMLIWKKCTIIAYSEHKGDWVLQKNIRRPLSRFSFAEALLTYRLLS